MSRAGILSLALSLLAGISGATEVETHVTVLAGEAGGGRATGSQAELRAARYLAEQLEALEAEPLPGGEGFLRSFDGHVSGADVTGWNVVGYLAASNGSAEGESWVLLGAHYDHIGRGEVPGSPEAGEEYSEVHPGADDNASGVAAVLAAAGRLKGKPLARNVILAFWSGSEIGGEGSRAFLASSAVDPAKIAAHVSLHMVGRMSDYRLMIQAVGTSPVWPRLIEQVNVPVGFSVQTDHGLREPGDVQSFIDAGIPSVELSTGGHADYHQPSDLPETLNYEDLEEVARFAALMVSKLAGLEPAPEFVEPRQERAASAPGAGARPFTGTIPDYAGEGEGLKLSGVVPGGPAEVAGLAEGDVIVELAGVTVVDAYDYMEALEAATIGEPMKVVFLREGERQETTMTPTARE